MRFPHLLTLLPLGFALLGIAPHAFAAPQRILQVGSSGSVSPGGTLTSKDLDPLSTRSIATKVMCIGDSNTEGVQGLASYRYPLWFDLRLRGYPVSFVGTRFTVDNENGTTIPDLNLFSRYYTYFDRDHQGYTGYRTDQVLPLISQAIASETPAVCLIMLGTNDVGQKGSLGVTDGIYNLFKIVDAVRGQAPATVFFIATLPPILPGTWYYNNAGYVSNFNNQLASQVNAWTTPLSPITLVDVNLVLNPATDLLPDGLHLNVSGQEAVAREFRIAMSPVFSGGFLPSPVNTTTVHSHSFETLGLADGITSSQPLIDWAYPIMPHITAMVMNPDSLTYSGAQGSGTPTGADGDEVLALENTGGDPSLGWVYQIMASTVEPGTHYNLAMAIGNRSFGNSRGTTSFGGYEIQILAGNSVVASSTNAVSPIPGTFATDNLSFDSNSLNSRLIGSPLTIRMRMTWSTANAATDFDMVVLTKY